MGKPLILDLFSGIGGFSLAGRWAGFETAAFCEIDPFCQKILSKHWPEVPIFDDIKQLTDESLRGRGIERVDLLTGGFPCQPFSLAGQRLGKEDDRHLWPYLFDVISRLQPDYVCCENVTGLIDLALEQVLSNLENEGYTVQTLIIPACALGTEHIRERVWILAHSRKIDLDWRLRCTNSTPQGYDWQTSEWGEYRQLTEVGTKATRRIPCPPGWGRNQPGVRRMAHGIPKRMDRLGALGNSIVPQVAYPILQAIHDQITVNK